MKNQEGKRIFVSSALCTLCTMFATGCGSPSQVGVGPSTQSGNSGGTVAPSIKLDGGIVIVGGNGGSGGSGVAGPPPTGNDNCGSATSGTSQEPADVLLLLDRSLSMSYSLTTDTPCLSFLGGTACSSRWSGVTSALNTTLSSTPGISWGLKLFTSPNGGACDVGAGAEVPIASNSAAAIEAQISGTSPANNTPTAAAVTAATAYLKTVTDQNGKFILLATDGQPNCKAGGGSTTDDLQGTLTAIAAAKAAGFGVYVIGIGPSVGNLDNMAQAGGTGKSYPATSPQDLTNALMSISKQVATCSFTSTQSPPDPNNIAVYLDKNLVPKDASNGWTFGSSQQTINLTGSYCSQITSGGSHQVEVLFGCAGTSPPSIIP